MPSACASPRPTPTARGSGSRCGRCCRRRGSAGAGLARCGRAGHRAGCFPERAGTWTRTTAPQVLWSARFDQLLGGHGRRWLAFGAFAIPQRQRGGRHGALFVGLELQRLHAVDRRIHCLEVLQHAERAFDHFALYVALMRDANVVRDGADDQTIATDKSELCPVPNYVPCCCRPPCEGGEATQDIAGNGYRLFRNAKSASSGRYRPGLPSGGSELVEELRDPRSPNLRRQARRLDRLMPKPEREGRPTKSVGLLVFFEKQGLLLFVFWLHFREDSMEDHPLIHRWHWRLSP